MAFERPVLGATSCVSAKPANMTTSHPPVIETCDLAIVGAGAAGLMAGIWAGRSGKHGRILVLESARKPGAKILVAGGGRCNVTHEIVDEAVFAGSTPPAIRKVLRRFDVPRTIAFFREMGVELKREETGKLFPTTDSARTVLEALLRTTAEAGVEVVHPRRVETVVRDGDGFVLSGAPETWGRIGARRVMLATGGKSLPKSGSDGHGYAIARSLGHSTTPQLVPGLVPLTLETGSFLRQLSGLSAPGTLEVRTSTGARMISFTGAILCTHFGLSGPAVLDISRYLIDAQREDSGSHLVVSWLPGETVESVDGMLRDAGRRSAGGILRGRLPERLARALYTQAGVDPSTAPGSLPRERRRSLAGAIAAMPIPVTGNRGFTYAEVTAGGVPLSELHLDTMQSRRCPGLSLCGEICDVDGRIGGFNFQWAWASGYVAGTGVSAHSKAGADA